jgi:hypothetical protein
MKKAEAKELARRFLADCYNPLNIKSAPEKLREAIEVIKTLVK